MFHKSIKKQVKTRNYALLCIMTISLISLLVKLAYVQLTEGPSLSVSANKQYSYEEDTTNVSFKLLDRNNKNLLSHTIKYYAAIDPLTFYTLNEDNAFIPMKNISYILRSYNKDYDISLLQYEMDGGTHSYEIDEERYEKLMAIDNVRGIYAYKYDQYEKSSNWNIKNILASRVKYSDNSKLKDDGTLERELYEYTKSNEIDQVLLEKDVSGNIIKETSIINRDNANVVTTIDCNIQNKIEEVLRGDKYTQYGQIGAVMMESSTGDILAMAQKDDNLSNVNIGVPSGNGFLLGSTFKTIVYEAALENHSVSEDKIFYLEDGLFPKSKEKLGSYNLNSAYIASSNNTFGQVGRKVGMDNIYSLANSMGLFDKVLNLQDEKSGIIEGYKVENNWDIISNTAIGQTVRVTPLEALSIPSTVVNNGMYVKPRIISQIVSEDGQIFKEYSVESTEVFSEHTASVIKEGMIGVVEDDLGTGGSARIDNLEVGGKTGTTEYFVGEKSCSDGWFAGFFNYNNKYYSMVVFIPQIEDVTGDSKTACTVFKSILENLIETNSIK